jgi:hypothetical protein
VIIVRHRINRVVELQAVPYAQGVEIDLRTFNGNLILQHDAIADGENFEDWLKFFRHKLLILNVKEEGLEPTIIRILQNFKITSYFFLDQSFPTQFKMSKSTPGIICTRVSEVEPISMTLSLNPGWVWFDSHSGNWDYLLHAFSQLQGSQVKKCLVSPELQRNNSEVEIQNLKTQLKKLSINFDAVCTKFPTVWS